MYPTSQLKYPRSERNEMYVPLPIVLYIQQMPTRSPGQTDRRTDRQSRLYFAIDELTI